MPTITLKVSTTSKVLGTVAVLLVLGSVISKLLVVELELTSLRLPAKLFDLDAERNLPTSYSVLLLLTSASLLTCITVLDRRQDSPFWSSWAVLALGFFAMAFDEGFRFHERLIDPVRVWLDLDTFGILYFAWVVPGLLLVVVCGLYFSRFLLWLERPMRSKVLLAAFLYVGGAIGVELLGGYHAELHGIENWTYRLIATAEESLEMLGLIVFIRALIDYCSLHFKAIRFEFR
ncbi:MAG: multidrug transporter [Bacteroidota bacterium]